MKKLLAVLLLFIPSEGVAQPSASNYALSTPMVADISHSTIQLHSSFAGAQLLIFGARNVAGDLVIVMRGPQANVTLRRKERIAGMWMNVEKHKYVRLPLFYAIASTRPLREIAPNPLLQRLGLGERNVIHTSNTSALVPFDRALARVLGESGNWQNQFGKISYFGESLFKAALDLPDTLPRGEYSVEVYLFRNGQLLGFQTIPLHATKVGFDARVTDEAMEHAWRYGLLAILMALLGGWLAHRLFHRP